MTQNAVFTFGRFQPPHIGHKKLIDHIILCSKNNIADHFVFLSHTCGDERNPLSVNEKLDILKEMFPSINFVADSDIRTAFHALEFLSDLKYVNITMVVGEDRKEPFQAFSDYTEDLGIKSFIVESAGARDPNSSDISGASSSKLRELVKEDNFDSFLKYVPCSEATSRSLFKILKERC